MSIDLSIEEIRKPLPSFSREDAIKKIRMAENAWNGRDPEKVASAYTLGSKWRNRDCFINGRDEIVSFLQAKWEKELEYRLIKELWAYDGNRIAVRFVYEWKDREGQWYRSHGNENWQFSDKGLMEQRHASINDVKISEEERKFRWEQGIRPDDHPGLTELGL